MDSIQQLSSSIASLLWPVLAAAVVWRLFPTIQKLVSSRGFTVKVGGFEFTAQEATDKLVESTAELQSRIAQLDRSTSPAEAVRDSGQTEEHDSQGTATPPSAGIHPGRVLWVDDIPDRRAYEFAQLEALGIRVDIARSTRAALDRMASRNFDAVITGMGRSEERAYSPTAGLGLVEAAKASSYPVPIFVFAAGLPRSVVEEIQASGGQVVTNSMHLFDALWASRSPQRD